jgi:hypothetical protein
MTTGSPTAARRTRVLAGPHEAVTAEQRVLLRQADRHVAAGAVDHGAGDATGRGDLGHDAAPHRDVGTAVVIDDDDRTRRDVVQEVTDRAAPGSADRGVAHGEGRSHGAEVVGQRGKAAYGTFDSGPVEGVGDRRGGQPAKPGDDL